MTPIQLQSYVRTVAEIFQGLMPSLHAWRRVCEEVEKMDVNTTPAWRKITKADVDAVMSSPEAKAMTGDTDDTPLMVKDETA